jgi:hypothetical protein
VWPYAPGPATYYDVGGIIVHSATGSDLTLTRDASGDEDYQGYAHDLWWSKAPQFSSNDGTKYFPPDESYGVLFTGSPEWPAQTLLDVAYMPAAFTPVTPVSNGTFSLAAGDLSTTYTPGTNAHLPPKGTVVSAVVFTSPGFVDAAGVELPIVTCQFDGESGSLTVPAPFIDIVRGYGSGHLVRQVMSVAPIELTGSSSEVRRVLVYAIWSYDTPWASAG